MTRLGRRELDYGGGNVRLRRKRKSETQKPKKYCLEWRRDEVLRDGLSLGANSR